MTPEQRVALSEARRLVSQVYSSILDSCPKCCEIAWTARDRWSCSVHKHDLDEMHEVNLKLNALIMRGHAHEPQP